MWHNNCCQLRVSVTIKVSHPGRVKPAIGTSDRFTFSTDGYAICINLQNGQCSTLIPIGPNQHNLILPVQIKIVEPWKAVFENGILW